MNKKLSLFFDISYLSLTVYSLAVLMEVVGGSRPRTDPLASPVLLFIVLTTLFSSVGLLKRISSALVDLFVERAKKKGRRNEASRNKNRVLTRGIKMSFPDLVEEKLPKTTIVIVGFKVEVENSVVYKKLDSPSDSKLGCELNKAFYDKKCDFISVRKILKEVK